jgi:hypothetical protein
MFLIVFQHINQGLFFLLVRRIPDAAFSGPERLWLHADYNMPTPCSRSRPPSHGASLKLTVDTSAKLWDNASIDYGV